MLLQLFNFFLVILYFFIKFFDIFFDYLYQLRSFAWMIPITFFYAIFSEHIKIVAPVFCSAGSIDNSGSSVCEHSCYDSFFYIALIIAHVFCIKLVLSIFIYIFFTYETIFHGTVFMEYPFNRINIRKEVHMIAVLCSITIGFDERLSLCSWKDDGRIIEHLCMKAVYGRRLEFFCQFF